MTDYSKKILENDERVQTLFNKLKNDELLINRLIDEGIEDKARREEFLERLDYFEKDTERLVQYINNAILTVDKYIEEILDSISNAQKPEVLDFLNENVSPTKESLDTLQATGEDLRRKIQSARINCALMKAYVCLEEKNLQEQLKNIPNALSV